ncbi:tetratricopeptide repeat protein [Flavobacterium lindanitolerans]|nr:tetratricopeptide repeat protein [Flavobacterium lindanitolerans]
MRVKLLNAAALKIIESDTDKALQLYKESEQLSEALQYKKGKAYSLLMSGRAYSKGDYPTSITYFQNSLEVYEDLKIKVSVANCHLNIGRSYYYLTDFPKALEHLKTATELSEQSGKLRVASNALMIIAMIYNTQGDYDKSRNIIKNQL